MRSRAGLGERLDLALGPLDHQVHVERAPASWTGRAAPRRRSGPIDDRRDEVAVHDVDVDDARAGVDDLVDLLARRREVGGEDRRGDASRGHDLGSEHRLPPQRVAASTIVAVLGHAHDRRVLAAVRAHRAQLEAVQAVARSGSGPGRFVGRSHGSPQRGHSARGRPSASARSIGGDKKPSVPSRCGRLTSCGHEVARRSGRRRPAPRSRRRDRAGRVDEARRRARSSAARRRGSRACSGASALDRRGVTRQRRSGCELQRARGPSTAGRRRTRSNAPSTRRRRVASPTTTSTIVGAHALRRCARSALGAARVALDGDDLALVAHQRGEVRRLAAGRGAQVEHALAGLRVDARARRARGARLRHDRAGARTARWPCASNGPSRTSASGSSAAACPGRARAARRASHERVDAQRELGGLVVGRQQRARLVGARASPTTARRATPGASGGSPRPRASSSARAARRPRAATRRSTALTSPAAAGCGLASSTDSATAAWSGIAVEEQQLVEPEPQRGADGRVELVAGRSASCSMTWSSVPRRWTVP